MGSAARVTVEQALARLGGVASWAELREVLPARVIRQAVREGRMAKDARGRYRGPEVEAHRALAHALTAVLSHLSAAKAHGWKVKESPELPQLIVPRHRKVLAAQRKVASLHLADLSPDEHKDGVTVPLGTVVDCARTLAFDAALAVADSALRSGRVSAKELRTAAQAARGPGARRVRLVAQHADGRAANPFESVLRALAIEVGFSLVPQLQIAEPGVFARVDLGDPVRRVVLEAESFAHHGTRAAVRRDCRRYTELAILQWSVLRFSYEDVMFEQDWTRWALGAWLAADEGRDVPLPPRLAA